MAAAELRVEVGLGNNPRGGGVGEGRASQLCGKRVNETCTNAQFHFIYNMMLSSKTNSYKLLASKNGKE